MPGFSTWMGSLRWLALMAGMVLALAPTGEADATLEAEFFSMPSGRIGCVYSSPPTSLRCDIRGGLKPQSSVPPRPAWCDLDWGDSVTLSRAGRTELTCHGDTVLLGTTRARVLRYGATWVRGPFTCTSRTTGLRCKNAAGHGFFLSLQRWRRF